MEERGAAAAAAVAGGHELGVWDGEDELPGAALSGVGRLLAGIGRGEPPLSRTRTDEEAAGDTSSVGEDATITT